MRPFRIQYFFVDSIKEKKSITLTLDQKGFVRIDFSSNLMSEIKKLILEGASLFSTNASISDGELLSSLLNDLKTRQVVKQHFSSVIYAAFKDEEEIIYVPAGRSVLATLSDQLHDLDITTMDLPLQEFIEIIQTAKQKFGSKIPEIVNNYTKTIDGQIKNADVDIAYSLIRKILKADYVNESDGEKLYYGEHQYVKLMYASSGQQEVLWILLLMFIKILEQKKVFLVLEEPEAHLFPTAQLEIIKLLSLLINSTESSVFITTHSPYILTSINLLLYSGKVENDHKNQSASPIIDRILRINPNKIQAYIISNQEDFIFESIKDSSEKLIDATRIDSISNLINEETEKLIDMEIEYDMQ